jgi:ubiquinol-cytochrome c reductase subunit 6
MLATLAEALEELKEAFVPTVAKAETEDEEEEEDEEDEDEDEEEEGSADPLDKLREECAKDHHIAPYVHHYAECVERVTKAQEDPDYASKDYKEDCVEEFFHLEHHINDCVQPRLFAKLK